MSARTSGKPVDLFWIYPVDGSRPPQLFGGTLHEVIAEIDRRHRLTGELHAAREV
jgi:hypothetical protein